MKKALVIIGVTLGVILLSLTAFVVWATWEWGGDDIRAEMDSVRVPSEWKLISEKNVGVIAFCPMGGCPSAYRKWSLDRAYSAHELEAIFDKYIPKPSINKKCDPTSDIGENFIYYCSGSSRSSKYQYYLSESKNNEGDGYIISLSITENYGN